MMDLVTPETVGISSERLAAINSVMQAYIDEGRFVGISTLIACKGSVIHFECYGKLDLGRGMPVRPNSLFRLASLTKPITAAAALILHEDGLFDLDEPVSKWLPKFKSFRVWQEGSGSTGTLETEITFRHLFAHTSGLGYGFGEPTHPVEKLYLQAGFMRPPIWNLNYPLPELVERITEMPLVAQPGTIWHYGLSHDVLGYLIELISDKPFEEFLRERLFDPLGMVDTSFSVPPEKLERFGPWYSYTNESGIVIMDDIPTSPFIRSDAVQSGGGGLVSTMLDYYNFMAMLANGGKFGDSRILEERTVTMMTTNQLMGSTFPVRFDDPWPGMGYGLGVGVQTLESKQVGWIGISGTTAWWYPQEEMIVIALPQAFFDWEASDRLLGMANKLFSD